jgi:hypothetical protein
MNILRKLLHSPSREGHRFLKLGGSCSLLGGLGASGCLWVSPAYLLGASRVPPGCLLDDPWVLPNSKDVVGASSDASHSQMPLTCLPPPGDSQMHALGLQLPLRCFLLPDVVLRCLLLQDVSQMLVRCLSDTSQMCLSCLPPPDASQMPPSSAESSIQQSHP